jgi:TM2 domain-containing membrane protein YozV
VLISNVGRVGLEGVVRLRPRGKGARGGTAIERGPVSNQPPVETGEGVGLAREQGPQRQPLDTKYCFACGATIDSRAEICPKCGVRQPVQPGMPATSGSGAVSAGDVVTRTGKTKLTASLLAILLGGLGAHKFYLGDTNLGVVYLIFCWTLIPLVLGIIEGVVWLTQPNDVWLAKFGDR